MSSAHPKRRKVLCYAPYNLWPLHGMWEITVLKGLALRGAEVKYVLCDGLYSDCDVYRAAANPRHALSCTECQSEVTRLMMRMGIGRFEWLGRYLEPAELREAEEWALGLPRDDLPSARYRGFDVGQWVASSVHTHIRVRTIDFAQRDHEMLFRSYLYSGLVAAFGLDRLLDDFEPDALFLFNGRMSSTRVALELANRRKIRVVCHERGRRWESLGISVNRRGPGTMDTVKRIFDAWGDIPLTREELDSAVRHMKNREHGKDLPWLAFSDPPKDEERLLKRYGLDPKRPLWALFTSAEDELVGMMPGPFGDQRNWVERTVAYVAAHPEIDLVIRLHPNVAGRRSAGQGGSQLDYFMELKERLPNNAVMIHSDDPVSSYSLMNLATLGLVYFSSVALEMACKGKQVILAADSIMSHRPFLQTVVDEKAYESMLDGKRALPLRAVSDEIRRLAYRYAYAHFFRFSIPFPLIKMTDKTHGEPRYSTLADLMPGKDESLDRICRIVLEDEPVCLPPGPGEKKRGDQEERRYFERPAVEPAKEGPEVSVIVTAYNYAHFLEACLNSVLEQSFQAFEVIVLDDHSSDDTQAVLKRYLKDPRIRTVRNKVNLKQPRNCNKGAFLARGEFLCFLHADDRFLPRNLEEKVKILKEHSKIPAVFSGAYRIDGAGRRVSLLTHPGRPDQDYLGIRDDYHDLMQFNYTITPGNVVVRRNAFEKAGRFNEKLINGCDWDLWIRVAEQGPFAFISEPLFEYRIHDSGLHSALRRENDLVVRDTFWMMDRYFPAKAEDPKAEEMKGLFAKTLIRMIQEIPGQYHKRYLEALKLRIKTDPLPAIAAPSLEQAEGWERKEDYLPALAAYETLLAGGIHDPAMLRFRLGTVYLKLLSHGRSAGQFARIPENHPLFCEAGGLVVRCLAQLGRYDLAEQWADRLIERFGDDEGLRRQRIDLFLEQWKLDAATAEIEACIGLGWEAGLTEVLEEVAAAKTLGIHGSPARRARSCVPV